MISIDSHTKIAEILKQHPAALEAVVAIHPRLQKLRNPLLRKLMAHRTTIAMAAKVAGCTVYHFCEALKPLGFVLQQEELPNAPVAREVPPFVQNLNRQQIVELDVRNTIEAGNDPMPAINKKIKTLAPKQVLKLINIFEPVPLVHLLQQQGFEAHVNFVNENLVETYFYKRTSAPPVNEAGAPLDAEGWDVLLQRFEHTLQTVDVRALQMPLPMMTILEKLDTLPEAAALHVHHKRIPVFLLPELKERNMDYRIKEVSDGDVQLLIFRISE